VQIGGINVSPHRVRDTLLQHPGVQDVAVRLMHQTSSTRDHTDNQLPASNRLKAFVVPKAYVTDVPTLETELLAWAQQRLSSAEQPRHYRYGSTLPKNEMGKLTDWDI
jgi:long-chain acyl-CoA synthetase